jgi:hypothetical protein
MSKLGLNVPINNLSFGSVSMSILRELFKRDIVPSIFPIGNIDLSAQNVDASLQEKIQTGINQSYVSYQKIYPSIKLWHIVNSLETYSRTDSRLITFHELDGLTPVEINILKQHDRVYVTSNYTKQIFAMFGINAEYIPLGFDEYNFKYIPDNSFKNKDAIVFFMGGKFEALRKRHSKILNLWAKKYGNDVKYAMNCAVTNPFMREQDVLALINQALEGKRYWNINFLPWSKTNAEYNQLLQSAHVVFALSGGEGRDLPCYHATAMGAWPLALRAHAYLDYLNDNNAVLINPSSKIVANDGLFFHQGAAMNQGNFFDWSEEDFYQGCEKVIEKAKQGLNIQGLELQKIKYKECVDTLLIGIE